LEPETKVAVVGPPAKQKWDVFICHASEDKDEIARPLAEALRARGVSVWYDEFSLKLGDSLRQSIDRGLAHSVYGVVILSPSFFEKHWPQQELNGLASKEVHGQKVIIPLWHKLGFDEVQQHSPMLADRLAARTDEGLENLVEKILDTMSVEPAQHAKPTNRPAPARRRNSASSDKKRFAVGAHVRITNPGINGVVIEVADEPTVMGEYWHKVRTKYGDKDEPGCNLELVPEPQS
jgi:hypothetical protein